MNHANEITIATFGEALWDCVPEGIFLGGAPLNVAYHAARLGARALPITKVGDDFLGDQIIERARQANLYTQLIKRHDLLETGVAIAQLDDSGNAHYDIRIPSAWDEISLNESEVQSALPCNALVYGSLATRSEESRGCLESLLQSFKGLKVYDMNLRQPYDDIKRAIHFARYANIVKLNQDELYRTIAAEPRDFPLENAVRECSLLLGIPSIVVTLGGNGSAWLCEDGFLRTAPISIKVADTIGAGDAFTAAITVFTLLGLEPQDALGKASDLGAFVASNRGAQPEYDLSQLGLSDIMKSN